MKILNIKKLKDGSIELDAEFTKVEKEKIEKITGGKLKDVAEDFMKEAVNAYVDGIEISKEEKK